MVSCEDDEAVNDQRREERSKLPTFHGNHPGQIDASCRSHLIRIRAGTSFPRPPMHVAAQSPSLPVRLTKVSGGLGGLFQPHARSAPIGRDEFNASGFERGDDLCAGISSAAKVAVYRLQPL